MSKADTLTLNMDDREVKTRLMQKIGSLRGVWDISFKERLKTRSLDANAYYWAAVVTPFAHYLREQNGDNSITLDETHEVLKQHILGTRELGGAQLTKSTRKMDKSEFSSYIEKCGAFLAEFAEIVVMSSDMFWELKDNPHR